MMNLAEHKDYFTNKSFGLKDLPGSLLPPMSMKDLVQGWENDGTLSLLNRFLPAFEGLKVTDERDFDKAADAVNSSMGKVGKEQKSQKQQKLSKTSK